LQFVEFAGVDEDADEENGYNNGRENGLQLPNPNADKANAQHGRSLETLLATKNKRLLEELTRLRVRGSFIHSPTWKLVLICYSDSTQGIGSLIAICPREVVCQEF
jgi:hypothetical protein